MENKEITLVFEEKTFHWAKCPVCDGLLFQDGFDLLIQKCRRCRTIYKQNVHTGKFILYGKEPVMSEETRPTGEEELEKIKSELHFKFNEWNKSYPNADIFSFMAEQLSLAREEAYKKIYDFVELESGKSGRKEILKFIDSLSNQSKDEK